MNTTPTPVRAPSEDDLRRERMAARIAFRYGNPGNPSVKLMLSREQAAQILRQLSVPELIVLELECALKTPSFSADYDPYARA